jgi:hypothetical protein
MQTRDQGPRDENIRDEGEMVWPKSMISKLGASEIREEGNNQGANP